MSGTIKGITIEFNGDTRKLDSALRDINKNTRNLDKELKAVDKALKFNPTSVELWRQKQDLLKAKISETKDKLDVLKQAQKQMDADGVDKSSKEYRELQRDIIETESKLKTFNSQLRQVGNANLKALSEQFKQVGQQMTSIGKSMSMYVTAPLTALGAGAAKSFAEVDKIMQLTNSTMGNTKEQADLLNQAMKDAAANSTYGMTDAAQATLNFARAGLTAEQAAAALAPAMNLAAGEGGELDVVSAGLVATINGFHGSFDDAAIYADVFANACNNSALDVNSLSSAMSVAAPIFSAAGYTVQDAALYMGVMANNGIEADKAANSLKTGLARLVAPAKDGAAVMEQLGISVTNADGSMKDSVTIQSELSAAFSKLGESEQLAAAAAIFGKNQMAPWLALINTAPSDVAKLNSELEATGTTNEMAAAMMSGFGGSLEKLKSSLDVAKTSLGEALAPAILAVSKGIQKLVDWFNGLSPAAQGMITTFGVIVAAIGPVLVILGTLISSIGTIIGAIGSLVPIIGAVAGPIGIIIGIIAAVVVAFKVWQKHGDKIKKFFEDFGKKIVKVWDELKKNITVAVENIKKSITEKFNNIKTTVTNIVNGVKTAITTAFNAIKTFIQAVLLAYVTMVRTQWTAIQTVITTVVNAIKTIITTVFNAIKTFITTVVNSIKTTITTVFNAIKTVISTTTNGIKTVITTVFNAIKSFVSTVSNEIKSVVSSAWNGIKSATSSAWNAIKTAITTPINAAKNLVSNTVRAIKNLFSFGDIAGKVRSAMDSVKNAISGPIEKAWSLVSSAIDKIKNVFPIRLGKIFSGVKLPHFKISGGRIPWGIGGQGVKPSVDIEWYKKGGIFSSPSVIGVGEAGSEAVVPLDKFWDKLDRLSIAASGGGNTTINVYAPQGMDVNALAVKIEQILVSREKQRSKAYGNI